jgi:hypothetical protein
MPAQETPMRPVARQDEQANSMPPPDWSRAPEFEKENDHGIGFVTAQ